MDSKRTRRTVVKMEIVSDSDDDISDVVTSDSDEEFAPPVKKATKRVAKKEPKSPKPKKQPVKKEPKATTKKSTQKTVKKEENAEETIIVPDNKKVAKKAPVRKTVKREIDLEETLIVPDNKSVPLKAAQKRKIKKEECLDETLIVPDKKCKVDLNSSAQPLWEDHDLLQENCNLESDVAKRIIQLFEEANTIPFIARYRKDMTGNMSADDLRDVKESYEKILALKSKIQTVHKSIVNSGKMDAVLNCSILGAKSMEMIEHLYAPFKPGSVRSLHERAKLCGLEEPALQLIENKIPVDLFKYIQPDNENVENISLVEKGVENILSHIIATDTDSLAFIHNLKRETRFVLESKHVKKRATKDEDAKQPKKMKMKNDQTDESKFANYFDYKNQIHFMKPHQILAINRGENLKILSVKIDVPDMFFNRFKYFCTGKWIHQGLFCQNRKKLFENAIEDAYKRIVVPLVKREIRSELKAKAEKASIEVFSGNLKQLLLMAPLKGKPILGIDPGFTHGCKLALISDTGAVLETDIVYPNKTNLMRSNEYKICKMLKDYSCTIIALGNGTACRETESWISDMISRNLFKPLEVTYTIVNENGASIYSCSKEAKKEFPDMDPNLISAASLARRIQEPLAELVKIEPKHLGVGMYQHDVAAKRLEEALNDVVSECVSFVGVDLNTASQCLLRRIAGLTDKRATEIINYREKNGPFISREDLKKVKGIGEHTFKQCAGFLRVGHLLSPSPANTKKIKSEINKLDHTIIHPESYDVAEKVMKRLNLNSTDIGNDNFITKIKQEKDIFNMYDDFGTNQENLRLIMDGLSNPLNHDIRDDADNRPLFKKGLTSIYDIHIGSVLTGCVNNVTHFGCFVDVGVGSNGLIHTSKMKNIELKIGDRVEVEVINLEIDKKRIGLELLLKL